MAQQGQNKFYPAATEEIANMLGLTGQAPSASPAQSAPVVVLDALPVTQENIDADVAAITGKAEKKETLPGGSAAAMLSGAAASKASAGRAIGKVILAVLPYVAVFAVGIFVYYGWFADPSNRPQFFKGIEKKATDPIAQKRAAFAALQKSEQGDFTAWISQYYYSVSDASVVAMDTVAPNKLTNFENYLLKLNPKTNDIRHTGTSDAEAVVAGIDPVTGTSLSDAQRDIVAQYFDADAIKSRLPGAQVLARAVILPRGPAVGQVVGSSTVQTSPVAPPAVVPPPVQTTTPPKVAPVTGAPVSGGCSENSLKINTSVPGRLEVPSMGVNVPIIWTTNEKNFDTDLKSGVVHYPCTPLPGDIGTSYISGHSSNYSWIKAEYNKVFAKMGDLPNGATFKVTVVGPDGKDIRLYYAVERKQVYEAGDQAQFTNTAQSMVALSTCWPINTTKQRMVAFGKLDRVER